MPVLSRWRRRLAIRRALLAAARARLRERKTKTNVEAVKLRKAQVAYAERVIDRQEAPRVHTPVETDLVQDTNDWAGPRAHDGIDLLCDPRAPLYAICDAEVVDVRPGGWWGKAPSGDVTRGDGIIQIQALRDVGPIKKGMIFGYGHAENATVSKGEVVKAGQVIGESGFAVAWHVHFMVSVQTGWTGRPSGTGDRDPYPFVRYAIDHGA